MVQLAHGIVTSLVHDKMSLFVIDFAERSDPAGGYATPCGRCHMRWEIFVLCVPCWSAAIIGN
jgi:hypothetical protein